MFDHSPGPKGLLNGQSSKFVENPVPQVLSTLKENFIMDTHSQLNVCESYAK